MNCCPNCGYCPHCGRSNVRPGGLAPYQPYNPWVAQPYAWPYTSITIGGGAGVAGVPQSSFTNIPNKQDITFTSGFAQEVKSV